MKTLFLLLLFIFCLNMSVVAYGQSPNYDRTTILRQLDQAMNSQKGGPAKLRRLNPLGQMVAAQQQAQNNFYNRSVGYMPLIIILPEGTNLSASVVVSADRRYVRYSGSPVFSSISKVTTFTYQGSP